MKLMSKTKLYKKCEYCEKSIREYNNTGLCSNCSSYLRSRIMDNNKFSTMALANVIREVKEKRL